MSGIERPHTVSVDTLPFLNLHFEPEDFDSLARGHETPQAAATLDCGITNIKKVQLAYILTAARERHTADSDTSGDTGMPWHLMQQAEEVRPEAVHDLLQRPYVGEWLHKTARQLQGDALAPEAFAALSGELNALIAVAACRAELSFSCASVTRYGGVYLPTLGKAYFEGTIQDPVAPVLLESDGDGVLRISQGEKIIVPSGPNVDAESWKGERLYVLNASGQRWEVVLDDLTRGFQGEAVPRLTYDAAEDWRILLEGSWRLLAQHHPQAAAGLSRDIYTVKPLSPTGIRKGATSSECHGAVAVRKPLDKTVLACDLGHEQAHGKLNKLEQLVRLFQPEAYKSSDLFYAPWRDDPRPPTALLHGAYSFMHVTEFWQQRSQQDDGPEGALAAFEYARWLACARQGAEQLDTRCQPLLTKNGRTFVRTMHTQLQSWSTDDIAETPRIMAAAAVADHAALWRAHHLQVPDTSILEEAVAAWRTGHKAPIDLWRTPTTLHPDVQAINFRARASLFRRIILEPRSLESLNPDMPATTRGDVWYATGNMQRAQDAYLELAVQPERWLAIRALVGFGLVRSSRAILQRPELVRALIKQGEVKADEIPDLVTWIDQNISAAQGLPNIAIRRVGD